VRDLDSLQRLARGDQAAFESIFRTHYAALVQIAESLLHERAIAEETVQEVMLELWRRRTSLAIETSLRAYLFRSTRNRALNYLRHETVIERTAPFLITETQAPATAEQDLADREIDAAVRDAVAGLPQRCREVFVLSRQQGLRYSEIAEILGISVKTVEAQMGKALRILRERLAAWLPSAQEPR